MLFSAIPSMPNLSVAHPLVLGRTTILFGFFNCGLGNFKIQGWGTKSQTSLLFQSFVVLKFGKKGDSKCFVEPN